MQTSGYPSARWFLETHWAQKQAALSAAEDEYHRSCWPQLEQALQTALEQSRLPEESPNRAEVDAWLREARLADLARR